MENEKGKIIIEDELNETVNSETVNNETEKSKTVNNETDNSGNEYSREKVEKGEAGGGTSEPDSESEDSESSDGSSDPDDSDEDSDESETPEDKLKKKWAMELDSWKDKYTRLYAEFDNFRKRTEKEKAQMFEMGAKDVIERLLPVVDNFERALGTVPEDSEDAFAKGVEGIYKQIQKMFSDLDVKVIKAEGEKFDPNLHNAVMTDTESEVPEDTVTQDLQKGYTYRGSVVRHSMVKVKKS